MPSKIQMYSDGGARGNPGPAAIGVVICDAHGEILREHGETIGPTTNNVAEYTAVIVGLAMALELKASEIDYYVDSELVAKQVTGKYKVKAPHIQKLCQEVLRRMTGFKRVTFRHVPREHEKIKIADKLVNEALDDAGH